MIQFNLYTTLYTRLYKPRKHNVKQYNNNSVFFSVRKAFVDQFLKIKKNKQKITKN